MAETIKIGGELESTATGNKVADVANIKDKTKGNKSQAQTNAELETALNDRYTKSETYNKTELNNMITTPNQEYETYNATDQTTDVTDVLPATGAADTVYRVGNWDGTQYNDSVFSEYAWNGSTYIKLSTKSQVGEVYDISANHADTKYADLAAALGTNGANIPQSLRKGGMSVKFVHSSDNKYIQARCMVQNFTTDVTQWQVVDDIPTAGSKNLVESGGIFKKEQELRDFDDEIKDCFNFPNPTNYFSGYTTSDIVFDLNPGSKTATISDNTIEVGGAATNLAFHINLSTTAGHSYVFYIESETELTSDSTNGIKIIQLTGGDFIAEATYSNGLYTMRFTAVEGKTYRFFVRSTYHQPTYKLENIRFYDEAELIPSSLKFSKLDNKPYTKEEVDALLANLGGVDFEQPNNPDLTDFFEHTPTYNNQGATYTISHNGNTINVLSSSNTNTGAYFKLKGFDSGKRYKLVFSGADVFSNPSNIQIFTGTTESAFGTPFIKPSISGDVITLDFYKDDREWYIYLPISWRCNASGGKDITVTTAIEVGEPTEEYIELSQIKKIDSNDFSVELLRRCEYLQDNPTLYKGMDIVAFNKCLCIGDSLTAGSLNTTDSQGSSGPNVPADPTKAYPAKLERLTGVACTNAGDGGKTFKSYYTAHQNDDWSGYEVAIILLGVNDADPNLGGGGWTQDSDDGLTGIITKLKAANSDIKIFVSTIINSMSYNDIASSAAAGRLKNVNDGIRDYVENLNDEDVILLDMERYGNLYQSNGYSCGHLSQYGYYRLAQDFCNYISWYMNMNKAKFRFIQFIGTDYVYTKDS